MLPSIVSELMYILLNLMHHHQIYKSVVLLMGLVDSNVRKNAYRFSKASLTLENYV